MPRGGFRPGAGRPRGPKEAEKAAKAAAPADVRRAARAAKMSPLDYMLTVMNDDQAEKERRDRMAIAAAPFVHAKPAEAGKGKKAEREEAAKGVGGKFGVRQPPRLVVDNP